MKTTASARCLLCLCHVSVKSYGLVRRQCPLLSFTLVFERSPFDREDPLQAGFRVLLPFTPRSVPFSLCTASCPGLVLSFLPTPPPALEPAACLGSFQWGTVSRSQARPYVPLPPGVVLSGTMADRCHHLTPRGSSPLLPRCLSCPPECQGTRAPEIAQCRRHPPLSSALRNRGISGLVSFLFLLGLNKICCPEYLK